MFLHLIQSGTIIRRRPIWNDLATNSAVYYVGTWPEEGFGQLRILIYEGCIPSHKVLEVGCGTLMAGYPIMQFLNSGNYVGIDPNRWLIDAALYYPKIKETVQNKCARFLENDQFDASSTGERFDFVISHSVLNHCAYWQIPLFLTNLHRSLKPGGKILASIRLSEGNAYGYIPYDGSETDFKEWQYPGTSAFSRRYIAQEAQLCGFEFGVAEHYLKMMTNIRSCAFQDWVVFTKI